MPGHDTDRPFALVQISDPHLYADPLTEYRGWNTDTTLDAVLNQLSGDGHPIDAIVLSGDLAQDETPAAYARLGEKLAHFNAPCYALPGNHDDPLAMRRHLPAQYLGEARLGNWRLLLLNSRRAGSINGYLDSQELARAEQFTAGLQQPGLIAVHHQPMPVGSSWIDDLGLDNGRALMDRVAGQCWLRGIVFGHVHQRFDARRRGIRLLGCPSTCRQFLPGAVKAAEDPERRPAYRRLWLHADDRLQTRVFRLKGVVPRSEENSS